MSNRFLFSISLLFAFFYSIANTSIDPNPEELGQVNWLRDYDQAIQLSEKINKPILILFQEVPGCSTCRNYGKNVLSHPLIVDAIEQEFVPLAIHNNKRGKDLKVLKSFGEPSWNNPVVRIIDEKRNELTPRIASQYTQLSLVKGMISALENNNKNVPAYLNLLEANLVGETGVLETATFGMYCFWTGESKLGNIDGVVETEPGFMNGSEVVQIKYDPTVIDYQTLTKKADQKKTYDRIFTHDYRQKSVAEKSNSKNKAKSAGKFRSDKEPQYYLSKSPYRFFPLLPIQATRINASIADGSNPKQWLAPKQVEMLSYIQKNPNQDWNVLYHNQHFAKAWKQIEEKIMAKS